MYNMKKVLIAIITFVPLLLFGQNDIQLSQQFLSRVNYNPAATGASEYINAYLIGRQQWSGFSGPSTQVLNAHNYFDKISSGLGLTVIHDKYGAESSINAKVAYAYHIHFENRSYLSFGLGAGLLYKNLDAAKLTAETGRPESDPTIATYLGRAGKYNPDFDFGIEYTMEKWQIGASVTHLNVSPITIKNYQSGRHFYLYTKYIFDLGLDWKLTPTAVGHMSSWPIMQLDLNLMAMYKNRFWFGASVRSREDAELESIVGIIGLFVTDFLRLGYSYDYNIGPIGRYSNGSHEIMLSARIGKGDQGYGVKTPRFFE